MRHATKNEWLVIVTTGIVGLGLAGLGCGPYPDRPNASEFERSDDGSDAGGDTVRSDGGEEPSDGGNDSTNGGDDPSDGGNTGSEMDTGTTGATGDGSGGGDGTAGTERRAEIVDCGQVSPARTVEIRDRRFVGGDVTVSPGSVIEFANREDDQHNVEYGQNPGDPDRGSLFESRLFSRGESVCIRFETPGDYPYLCRVHPDSMQKTVTVEADDGNNGDTGGGNGDGGGTPETPREVDCANADPAATVRIVDRTYEGGRPTISPGEVVEWTNEDDEEHTVVSGTGEEDPDRGSQFDSGEFEVGDSYCVEFPKGTYPYFCRIRGADDMTGQVDAQ